MPGSEIYFGATQILITTAAMKLHMLTKYSPKNAMAMSDHDGCRRCMINLAPTQKYDVSIITRNQCLRMLFWGRGKIALSGAVAPSPSHK